MIQVYNPGNTDYQNNGDSVLFPTEAYVHPKMNSSWEVSLTHPLDEEKRWKYVIEDAIIKMPSFNGEQLFRIKKKEKRDSGVTATLQPIFLDAKEDCFLLDVRPTDKTGQEALNIMLASNNKYKGRSDILKRTTAYFQTVNFIEALNGEADNSFISRWGGEILYDNYTVHVDKRIGSDRGLTVLYGKNIKADGFTEEIDMSNVVTRIIPKAYNGYMIEGDAPWVDSPIINKYQTVKHAVIKFDDVKMVADKQENDELNGIIICNNQTELEKALRDKCTEQFESGIDKPKVTITVDMELLKDTDTYADVKELETVSFGDTVHCKHKKLDIITDARVIDLKWDCIKNTAESVTLGDFQFNFFNNVSSTVNRVNSAIRKDGSLIAEQVQGIIDGVAAQMRAQSSIAKKTTVRAVLFEDLDPQSTTFGAMCLGTMGFQIAKERTADNSDWKWSTFGTGKGFFADYVVAGTMLAERIRGGTLEIGGSTGENGIIRVLNSTGVEIGRWDSNGLSVKQGDISGASVTLGGLNNSQGLLKVLNGVGEEIVRLDRDGIYAKGKYVCYSRVYDRTVEVSEGAFRLLRKDGSLIGMLLATSDEWMTLKLDSGTAIAFSQDYLSFNAENIEVGGNIHVSGYMGKSGRAMFSDGSYLDFRKGFLVGGNTTEGGAF